MKQLVQALQVALQKEKVTVRSLEEQVCGFKLVLVCKRVAFRNVIFKYLGTEYWVFFCGAVG